MTEIYQDPDCRQQPPSHTPTPSTPPAQLLTETPSPSTSSLILRFDRSPITPSVSPSPPPGPRARALDLSPRSRLLGPIQTPPHQDQDRGRSRSPYQDRSQGHYRSQSPRQPRQPLQPVVANRVNAPGVNRDDKVAIQTLRDHTEYTMAEISRLLGFTQRQVQYALQDGPLTPQKRPAKKGKLSDEQLRELKAFLDEDFRHRTIA
ncbi:hypothetical protein J3E68DRAFT_114110 [Trichoderma sp. SZMC 28012]